MAVHAMSGECERCGWHCLDCTCDGRELARQREVADSPFGIHEALHTCSVLMDTFGCRVAEHPAVALRPDILAKAEEAIERMMDVYQSLGRLPEWSAELTPASAIEAASAGETPQIGSTEGESAVPKGDAQ
jgi:hypothetical protein